jgi:hypothetical protein
MFVIVCVATAQLSAGLVCRTLRALSYLLELNMCVNTCLRCRNWIKAKINKFGASNAHVSIGNDDDLYCMHGLVTFFLQAL